MPRFNPGNLKRLRRSDFLDIAAVVHRLHLGT